MSAYWSDKGDINSPKPQVKLAAGFADGHVETFMSSDTVPLRVSKTSDGSTPYSDPPLGPGIFYLPRSGSR